MRSRSTYGKKPSPIVNLSPKKILRIAGVLIVVIFVFYKWTNPTISDDWCNSRFGEARGSIKRKSKTLPPILYSYSGSGVVWLRLFVEFATGSNTGSIHSHDSRTVTSQLFKWDHKCDQKVSLVLVNPTLVAWTGSNSITGGSYNQDATFSNCYKSVAPRTRFNRMIVLLRDPWDTVFRQYERFVSKSTKGRVFLNNYDEYNWQEWASFWSYRYKYLITDQKQLAGAINSHNDPDSDRHQDYHVIKYEDLMAGKMGVMMNLIQFIDPEGNLAPRRAGLFSKGDERRVQCAKTLADKFVPKQFPINSSVHVTKEMVYADDNFVCAMWAVFGEAASKYGYGIYRNVDCSKIEEQGKGYLRDVSNPTKYLNVRPDRMNVGKSSNDGRNPILVKESSLVNHGKIERPDRVRKRERERPPSPKFARQKKRAQRHKDRRNKKSKRHEEWDDEE